MSEAREEAARRYPNRYNQSFGTSPLTLARRNAFVAGAEWARDHFVGLNEMVTDAQVEVAAQLMWKERALGTTTPDYPWRGLAEEGRERLREHARAVLKAAREVQG